MERGLLAVVGLRRVTPVLQQKVHGCESAEPGARVEQGLAGGRGRELETCGKSVAKKVREDVLLPGNE